MKKKQILTVFCLHCDSTFDSFVLHENHLKAVHPEQYAIKFPDEEKKEEEATLSPFEATQSL